MQERDIKRVFDGILPNNELKTKVLEAIDRHEPHKFNLIFSRIVPVALCAVVLVNGFILYKSLPEKNNPVIPLDLSSADISNSKVVDINTIPILTAETVTEYTIATPQTQEETTTVTDEVSTDGLLQFSNTHSKMRGQGYYTHLKQAPDFLNEELKKLFNEAVYIWENLYVDTGFGLSFNNEGFIDFNDPNQTVQIDGYNYIKSGVSYESFYNYLSSVYTESLVDSELFKGSYKNVDGELVWLNSSGGFDITRGEIKFELVLETDSMIKIKRITNHSWSYSMSKKEFKDKNIDGPYEWIEEDSIIIVKTENGWRFEEFSLW